MAGIIAGALDESPAEKMEDEVGSAMSGWVRLGRVVRRGLAGMAVMALATGCGTFFIYPGSSSSSSSTTGNYVYVANATTDNVAAFAIGSGTLTAVSGSPFSLGYAPSALVVSPANSFLYVGGNNEIYAYAIASTGALSQVNGGSPVGVSNVQSMTISPDGNWLFALDINGLTIDEFEINKSTGLLTPLTATTYTGLPSTSTCNPAIVVPTGIAIAPNADYLYASLGTAGTLVYNFNTSTGGLSSPAALAPVSCQTSDNAVAVNSTSTALYIARSGTSGGLAEFSIASTGALTEVGAGTVGTQPYSIALNSTGTDVYEANRGDSTISGFSTAVSSGALTALTGSPYTSGTAVTQLATDRSGTYLLAVAFNGGPDLSMYSFDTTSAGKLDLAAVTTTGTDPTGAVALAVTH